MAANANEETEIESSSDVILGSQQDQLAEALAEWRSSEQLENDTPSTSPPYWDTDDDDDDYEGGPKPSELYGKYTWRIEKFSEIKKRELRSDAFEVGGYKWYILIYPQGCDVCNHLSLFLCVANYDQLMPGWSHFAQFTISAVNKDPKKSKYSDTLHRFWKKEHDWGWKKFMELPKLKEGFLDGDTLIIKAQVQIIREKADRPFRCLDCRYRRELLRAHLTSVEQTCRHFIEDRRSKLWKFLEDKETWFSFRKFWKSMDRNARICLSKEGIDVILKVLVKNFFVEKDAASTLVMDSLYSGLKALENQSKRKKLGDEEASPLIHVEDDTFVFADDVLRLIERSAMEPLPEKDDEASLSGSNEDGFQEEFSREAIERDERRLTELGRRTIEAFIIAHIFNNKIKASYHEAVALKLQEELIREEELAEKRVPVEKEKKVKKKQSKQKRNNKKSKGKSEEPYWKQTNGKSFYLEEPDDMQNNPQGSFTEELNSWHYDPQDSYPEENNENRNKPQGSNVGLPICKQNNALNSYADDPICKQNYGPSPHVEEPGCIQNNGPASYVDEPCDVSDSEPRKDASSPSSSMDSVHSQVQPFQTKGKSSARSESKPSNQYIKKSNMASNGKLSRNLAGNVAGNVTNTSKKAAIGGLPKEKVVEKKVVERPVARVVTRPSSAPLSYKNAIVGNSMPQLPPLSQSNRSSESKRQFLNRQSVTDEFPHLDIINDLLDDEHCGSSSARCYERTRGYDGFSREYVPNSSSVWRANSEGAQTSFFGSHYSSLSCGFSAYPFFRPSNGR